MHLYVVQLGGIMLAEDYSVAVFYGRTVSYTQTQDKSA